jgi:hypothetical protein
MDDSKKSSIDEFAYFYFHPDETLIQPTDEWVLCEAYPEDMEIWISDNGYCEGAERLTKIKKLSAYDAGLDGDSVNDEYLYIEDMDIKDISKYLQKGYLLNKKSNVLYKEIILFE